jgi:GGDEF domain-containing protein
MARLYAFTPLCDVTQGLFVVVGTPAGIVYAEANRILTRNLLALGVATALALLAAWLLGHLFVIGRTRLLVNTARRLAAGELGARSGLAPEEGEFGQLAQAFDGMAAVMQQRQQALRESEAKYRSLVKEIPAITYIIALALANLRLRQTLRGQAIRDPLPGLFNRRYLEEALKRELQRVRRLRIHYMDQVLASTTISLGVASFPEHGGDGDMVIRAADQALYCAKQEGRDLVVEAAQVNDLESGAIRQWQKA